MRLKQLVLGVLAILIVFAVFAFTSSPRGQLRAFKPYVTSQNDGYDMQDRPGMKPQPIYFVKMRIDGKLTLAQAKKIAQSLPQGTHGFSYRAFPRTPSMNGTIQLSHKGLSGMQLQSPDDPVTEIYYWKSLRWNEILWARLTHLGSNPFPDRR